MSAPSTDLPAPRLNEVEDVIARLKVGRSTVFALLATKELRSVKIGRRRLIPERALLDYIARLDEQSYAEGGPSDTGQATA